MECTNNFLKKEKQFLYFPRYDLAVMRKISHYILIFYMDMCNQTIIPISVYVLL